MLKWLSKNALIIMQYLVKNTIIDCFAKEIELKMHSDLQIRLPVIYCSGLHGEGFKKIICVKNTAYITLYNF